MTERSSGLLMYRRRGGEIFVFLVHPGGPYYTHKNEGSWSIPKGILEAREDPLGAAIREFREETGINEPEERAVFLPLGSVKSKGGKIVEAWAFESSTSCPEAPKIRSNTFSIEWPPKSGRSCSFPEADRGAFFDIGKARLQIQAYQLPLLERCKELLS